MDGKVIGLKIKKLRSEKSIQIGHKYTGEMLANDLNISRSYLGDIESGRTYPSEELIEKLSFLFNVSKDYFLENENNNENVDEFDEETRAIAREMKNLSNENKDILKRLIKSMIQAGDNELKK